MPIKFSFLRNIIQKYIKFDIKAFLCKIVYKEQNKQAFRTIFLSMTLIFKRNYKLLN